MKGCETRYERDPGPLSGPRFEIAHVIDDDGVEHIGRWRPVNDLTASILLRQRYGLHAIAWLGRQLEKGMSIDITEGRRMRLSLPWDDSICDMCGGARDVVLMAGAKSCTKAVCPKCNADGALPPTNRYTEIKR